MECDDKTAQNENPKENAEESEKKEEEYSFDSSSYSMSGSDIPENKTYFKDTKNQSEFEVSYDSQSGAFTHREYRAENNNNRSFTPNLTFEKPKKKSSGKNIFLILSCAVISIISGALMATLICSAFLGGSPTRGSLSFEDATVKVNYAETGDSPLVTAAEIANPTVVTINTYLTGTMGGATKVSAGSGVIWTDNGYIVTCNHVIENAQTIVVTLSNEQSFEAQIVGVDPVTDLAVIKINASDKLPATTIRGTALILGEAVVAIGNPLGALSNTVTDGIISSLERQITVEGKTMTLIQTNAAVNHGNSGGGLFDCNGSLVGIVNAKSTEAQVEGIGFAIPVSTAVPVVTDLIEKGYVSGRAYFGFEGIYITASNYTAYPALEDFVVSGDWIIKRVNEGFYITDMSNVSYTEDSSHLEFGDRVERVGDMKISSESALSNALLSYSAGDTVELTVVRNNRTTLIIRIILAETN